MGKCVSIKNREIALFIGTLLKENTTFSIRSLWSQTFCYLTPFFVFLTFTVQVTLEGRKIRGEDKRGEERGGEGKRRERRVEVR